MTVTYTARVANARFCGFSKLLLAWKGSIYKVLYKEFLAFFAMYTAISITYRWGGEDSFRRGLAGWHIRRCFGSLILVHHFHPFRFFLHDDQKRYFEKLAIYCNHYASLIPMSFVLGKLYWCSRQLLDNRKRGRNWAVVCPRPLLCMVFASFFLFWDSKSVQLAKSFVLNLGVGTLPRELRVEFQGSPAGLHNTGCISEIICLKIDCIECVSQNQSGCALFFHFGPYIIVIS